MSTRGRTGSAAAPGFAFPAEQLAAARAVGSMTEYLKAWFGGQERGQRARGRVAVAGLHGRARSVTTVMMGDRG